MATKIYTQADIERLKRVADSTKKAEDIDAYNSALSVTNLKYIGLQYPLQRGNIGYFDSTYSTLQTERAKLIALLSTIAGERYYQPNLGLELEQYLFEQDSEELRIKIKAQIMKKIKFWLPNISVNNLIIDILINEATTNPNLLNISVNFSLINDAASSDTVIVNIAS